MILGALRWFWHDVLERRAVLAAAGAAQVALALEFVAYGQPGYVALALLGAWANFHAALRGLVP